MATVLSRMIELCVFRREPEGVRYLLLHRSPNEPIYPDIWQFVTGSIEGDERATDAALRELAEETGLTPRGFWVVPYVVSFYDPSWDTLNLSPLFAAEVDAVAEPRLSGEHSEFGWYPYAAASPKLAWPSQQEGLRTVNDLIVNGVGVSRLTRII